MRRLTILVFFILLACSKDAPIPDAVVPAPTVTFTLTVAASEGGTVSNPGDTHNENTNVTLTASPAEGYAFSGWTGDATGSTNPLSVSMTSDKNITASFIRLQYSLGINIIGSGTVSQVLVESTEKNTDYDSFSTVRLTATPETGWVFYGWSGSTTETTSEVDIVMEETKSVTATFEEQLNQVIGVDDVFFGIGKWKIRKPKGSSGSGNTVDESSKQMLANCELLEIIFRTDGSFTIVTGTTTTTGQFIVDSNTSISLIQAQSTIEEPPFGTITNLVLSDSFISFSIQLADGCTEDAEGNRDEDYVESEDPITSANCAITSSLDNGSESQTIAQTNSIEDIVYSFSTTCTGSLSASADNLPPGVTMNFSNNQAILSGTPTSNASGTYDYTIVVTAPNIATSVSGQISVVGSAITSCTISGQNISGGQSQTVTLTNAISDITFAVNSSCEENLQEEVIGLPTGVTMNFSDNTAIISGTPTGQTGAYSYVVNWYSSTSSFTLGGTINVVADSTTSTSTSSSSTADTTTNYYSSGGIIAIESIVFYDRELTINGIKLIAAGEIGGQEAVPDKWIYKTAQVFKLLIDKDSEGIDSDAQLNMIKTLKGEIGWHQGRPTGQRIARGGGNEYSPGFLDDNRNQSYPGIEAFEDVLSLDDMVWYKNIDSQGTGDDDINEIIEHTLHTLHRFGVRGGVEGSTEALNIEASIPIY